MTPRVVKRRLTFLERARSIATDRNVWIAVPGSLVVVWLTLFVLQPVADRRAQYDQELRAVESLRPGGNVADLTGALGEPPAEISRDGDVTRYVYVLPHSAVLAVADADERVLLTSVTSYDPAFRPSIATPCCGTIKLWESTPQSVTHRDGTTGGFYSDQVIGHIGAHDAYYFEWGGGPSYASMFRYSLWGYSFLSGDVQDDSIELFMPFLENGYGLAEALPDTVGEDQGLPAGWAEAWGSSSLARSFRSQLRINTVGTLAMQVDPMVTHPSALDREVWAHRMGE